MMKPYIYAAVLCGGVFLSSQHSVSAAVCAHISCADMGYTQSDILGCTSFLYCPFDTSYKACAKYADIKKDTCPEGAVCEASYKFNGCKAGYTLSNGVCVADACDGVKLPSGECVKLCNGIYKYTEVFDAYGLVNALSAVPPAPSEQLKGHLAEHEIVSSDNITPALGAIERRKVIVVSGDIHMEDEIPEISLLTNGLTLDLSEVVLVGPNYLDCSATPAEDIQNDQPTVYLSRSNTSVPFVFNNTKVSDVNLYFGHHALQDDKFTERCNGTAILVDGGNNVVNNVYMDVYTEGSGHLMPSGVFWMNDGASLTFEGNGLFHVDARYDGKSHRFIGNESTSGTVVQKAGSDIQIHMDNTFPALSTVSAVWNGNVSLMNVWDFQFEPRNSTFNGKLIFSNINNMGYTTSVVGSTGEVYFPGTSLEMSYKSGAKICVSANDLGCWRVLKDGCRGTPNAGNPSCFEKIGDYQAP